MPGRRPSASLTPDPRIPPYLVLLRVGLPSSPYITARAVRSYRTISPLPGLAVQATALRANPLEMIEIKSRLAVCFSVALAVHEP